MRLLLDTHIALWAVLDDERLSTRARDAILQADQVWVSTASLWELAIKASLPKSNLGLTAAQAAAAFNDAGYASLPVTVAHALAVESLETLHRDPFDRLLVAQARTEPLVLATADPQIARYTVPLLFAP